MVERPGPYDPTVSCADQLCADTQAFAAAPDAARRSRKDAVAAGRGAGPHWRLRRPKSERVACHVSGRQEGLHIKLRVKCLPSDESTRIRLVAENL